MTSALTLKCRYSFAPGFDWAAELTFKPLKRGFAVTGQLAEDEEAGIRRIVGKSSELLTWRSACTWLEQNGEAGLAGDVLWAIKHDAEVPWQGELVAWTWICHGRTTRPSTGMTA